MALIGEAREAGDHATGAHLPIGRIEAGKGRHDIDVAIILDAAGEVLDLIAALDQAQIVAQPLHQGTGDRDRALERIARLGLAEAIGDGGDQPGGRLHRRLAGIHQEEAAGAIGVLIAIVMYIITYMVSS